VFKPPPRGTVVVARCPLRISFAGGGSDNDWYTSHRPGAVLSGAISTYVHARVSAEHGESDTYGVLDVGPDSPSITESGTKLHQQAWDWFKAEFAVPTDYYVSISTASDVPRGSGLGASSALMVAILGGLFRYFAVPVTRAELARAAYFVERDLAGVTGGYQDHYAAANGSLNFMQFFSGGVVEVCPLPLSQENIAALEARLTLVFSGTTRESAKIISLQYENLAQKRDGIVRALDRMVDLAALSRDALLASDLASFTNHVSEAAGNKRHASPESYNQKVNAISEAAMSAGADVCKVSGAGGGGFLLAISSLQKKPLVDYRLWELGYQPRNLTFDHTGLLTWCE